MKESGGKNRRKTTSKSNNKNNKVNIKKRMENGIRDTLWCSKPHSYADSSSRLKTTRSPQREETSFNKETKIKEIVRSLKTKDILQLP